MVFYAYIMYVERPVPVILHNGLNVQYTTFFLYESSTFFIIFTFSDFGGPWAALGGHELWPGYLGHGQGAPELIMSYKYLTYLVERRNSPVNLPYILYKPCYTISDGTHLHGPNRRDLAEK